MFSALCYTLKSIFSNRNLIHPLSLTKLFIFFFQSFIQIIEKEDLPPGKPIGHIKASDKDEVGTANAAIRFTLDGEGADRFMLDRDSGKDFF